ncbi:MAG: hypothetical protein QXF12_04360 [Candidatus Aenigmatarchaeota archaeon]
MSTSYHLEQYLDYNISYINCSCFVKDRDLENKDFNLFMSSLFFMLSRDNRYSNIDYILCDKRGVSFRVNNEKNSVRLYFFIFNINNESKEYYVAFQNIQYIDQNYFNSMYPFMAFKADNIIKDKHMATKFFIIDRNGDYIFSIKSVSEDLSKFIKSTFYKIENDIL